MRLFHRPGTRTCPVSLILKGTSQQLCDGMDQVTFRNACRHLRHFVLHGYESFCFVFYKSQDDTHQVLLPVLRYRVRKMLDGAISVTQDLASRAQLHKLRQLTHPSESGTSNDVSSSRFRVHGWRWHHLGIVRDLARLHTQGTSRKAQMCDVRNPRAQESRRQFFDALRYIINDNWALHNFVEENVMLPWIDRRERNGVTEQRHAIIEKERQRLETDSKILADRVDKWVGGRPRTCEREADVILGNVERLRRNASMLFEASEAVLVPQVMRLFSEKEQLKFNSTVLKAITGRQARISLVIFRDAVDQTEPVVAKKVDTEDFENSVPGPIRRLALPYWRSKFVDERIRFITGSDSR